MNRNVISQFLVSVHQNFYEAHRAMIAENPNYSADQVAAAAFRLRTLYRDIEPNDLSVAAAVRTAFTNHIEINAELINMVESNLEALDKSYSTEEAQSYYRQLFDSWLGLQPASATKLKD
jgi:hypothetical protein